MEDLSKEDLKLKFEEQRDIYCKANDAMIDIEQRLKKLRLDERPILTVHNSYHKHIRHLESKTYYIYILRYNEDKVDYLWFCKTEKVKDNKVEKLGLDQGINIYYDFPNTSIIITKEEFDSAYLEIKESIGTFNIYNLI